MIGQHFLVDHPQLHSLLADGALHSLQIHIDESFTEIHFRAPGIKPDAKPLEIDHLSDRLTQNLASAAQKHDNNKWYTFDVFLRDNLLDTNQPMQRSARLDQPNVGASMLPRFEDSATIPAEIQSHIESQAKVLHAIKKERGCESIAAEISSTLAMPDGQIIPLYRITPIVHDALTGKIRQPFPKKEIRVGTLTPLPTIPRPSTPVIRMDQRSQRERVSNLHIFSSSSLVLQQVPTSLEERLHYYRTPGSANLV